MLFSFSTVSYTIAKLINNFSVNIIMPYLLVYPYKILIDGYTKTIDLVDIIKHPLLSIFPYPDKVNYPVYLKLNINRIPVYPRTSGVCWVDVVRECLRKEGFRETSFHVKKGEMLSMYRRVGKLDVHTRIMKDGSVLSEIEPSRYSLSHLTTFLFPTVLPCLYEVKTVFDKHKIPYKIMHEGEECKILSFRTYFLDA